MMMGILSAQGPSALVLFLNVAALAALISLALVLLGRVWPRLAGQAGHLKSVQAAHSRVTPRVGGVAIFAALCASMSLAPWAISERLSLFLVGAAVLFLVGLAEDLGAGISPLKRLVAAIGASLVVVFLLGMWLPRIDIGPIDSALGLWYVGVPLTLLITAGVANGFNLIDGVNGLSAFTGLCAALALAYIAGQGGAWTLQMMALLLAAAILGFLVLNYPFGLIFLGDAGAYTLGFVIAWFGISLLRAIPEVSAWAVLLTVFWPVSDTMLAIYRRWRLGAGAMAPDRLHVHQLVMRMLEIRFLGKGRRHISNPLTTLVLAPFVMAPPLTAVLFWDKPVWAMLAVAGFTLLFWGSYFAAFRLCGWVGRRRLRLPVLGQNRGDLALALGPRK